MRPVPRAPAPARVRETAVRADEPLDLVLEWLGSGEAAVIDGQDLVGLVQAEDVQEWLDRGGGPRPAAEPFAPPRPDL
jgi:hypothetical protein